MSGQQMIATYRAADPESSIGISANAAAAT